MFGVGVADVWGGSGYIMWVGVATYVGGSGYIIIVL